MKKFLSVVLALMMVVSTVSFAAPSAVTVADNAADAAADVNVETTEKAELAEVHNKYGQLVYEVNFEQDDFALDAFQTAYAQISSNNIVSYKDPSFDLSNLTVYTNNSTPNTSGFCDGFAKATLVEEDGNTYIQGDVDAGYDGYFRMTKYNLAWPDGYYTFSVDVKAPADQVTSFAKQCNDTKIPLTPIFDFNTKSGDWQTVVYRTTNVVEGENIGSGDKDGFYGFFVALNNATAGTVSYDNWRVYYSPDEEITEKTKATVVIDSNGRSGVSNMPFEGLTPNTKIPVSAYLSQVQDVCPDVIGFATTPGGETVSEIYLEYYTKIYAVYGFDVSVLNNGNSSVSNVTVSDIDTRKGITVGELVAKINNTSDKVLRGVSETVDGQPLAASTIINTNKTLYMIWETDESEYGTLLFNIDFEQYAEGYEINEADNNYKVVETFDSDAITNGEFTMNWQLLDGGAVAVEADGNKYLRGKKSWAQFRIENSKYNAASAPMATGIYTVVADVIDFGTSGRIMSAISQVSTNIPAEMVDTWSGKTNTWDKVVGRWQNIEYRNMTWYFTDNATTEVGFDNIKLYFEPVDETVFYVTVNANGKSGASNAVVEVDAGKAVTVADLKAAMPGCIGIAETATGDMLADNASILPLYNKTVYAVWGFDVTLNAGQNTEMSNVVVRNIDTRRGTTIGALIDEINNTTDRTLRGLSTAANGNVLPESTPVNAAATYYMIWELDEEEFGTLILDIDFEKEGLTSDIFTKNARVADVATSYNKDLVKGNVYFILGQSSQVALPNPDLVTENGNTYLKADTNTKDLFFNFIQISEWSNDVEWLNGTYTYVVDFKVDKTLTGVATHVNNNGNDVVIIDSHTPHSVGEWETEAFTYNGVFSTLDLGSGYLSGSMYIAPNVGEEVSTVAVDNIKVYFKTDETVFTIKNGGNRDLEDLKIPVSTTEGITVQEMIDEVNKYETQHVLLGISDTSTGAVLDPAKRIIPDYQRTYYMVWKRNNENEMINNQLGKLLFAIDFEREEVIKANWNGYYQLDNVTEGGEQIRKIASLYDEEVLTEDTDFRALFITNDWKNTYFEAGIKASEDGENHWLEGVNGDEENGTKNPQFRVENGSSVTTGDGIYTVFIDVHGPKGSTFRIHPDMAGYNTQMIDYYTYKDAAWEYKPEQWNNLAYKYTITDGTAIPKSSAYFSLEFNGQTVAFDNYKLYYKPFTATITLDPGEYKEFGTHYVENISTTGENTAQDILDELSIHFAAAGKTAVGLLDADGFELDLEEKLIIPCDMTYTIIWGEDTHEYVETVKENSIRYSSNENKKGIRFAATTKHKYAYDGEHVTEYGWIVTRKVFLDAEGIRPTCFTLNSKVRMSSGKNYDSVNHVEDANGDGRKHFAEEADSIVITMVVYGLKTPEHMTEVFVARPYMKVDGVTYYGQPWERSIYDTALALRKKGYPNCDDDVKAYIDYIISVVPDIDIDVGDMYN